MNPWAEFQQYQQPSNLGPLLATPQAPPPSGQAMQGASPPSSPEEYAQRVQGWTGALQELVQNPGVAAMLIQLGTGLSSGQSGGEAIASGFGAMGRAAGIQNQLQQQGLKNQMEERRFGLGERELGLREQELKSLDAYRKAQIANMGRSGGGRAGPKIVDADVLRAQAENQLQAIAATLNIPYEEAVARFGAQVLGLAKAQAGGGGGGFGVEEAMDWAGKYGLPGEGTPYDLASERARQVLQPGGQAPGWQPTQAQPQMPGPDGATRARSDATSALEPIFATYATEAEATAACNAGRIPANSLIMAGGKRFRCGE